MEQSALLEDGENKRDEFIDKTIFDLIFFIKNYLNEIEKTFSFLAEILPEIHEIILSAKKEIERCVTKEKNKEPLDFNVILVVLDDLLNRYRIEANKKSDLIIELQQNLKTNILNSFPTKLLELRNKISLSLRANKDQSLEKPRRSPKLSLKEIQASIQRELNELQDFVEQLNAANQELKKEKHELSVSTNFSDITNFIREVKKWTPEEYFSREKIESYNIFDLKMLKTLFEGFKKDLFELFKNNINDLVTLKIACERKPTFFNEKTKQNLYHMEKFQNKIEGPFHNYLNFLKEMIALKSSSTTNTYQKAPYSLNLGKDQQNQVTPDEELAKILQEQEKEFFENFYKRGENLEPFLPEKKSIKDILTSLQQALDNVLNVSPEEAYPKEIIQLIQSLKEAVNFQEEIQKVSQEIPEGTYQLFNSFLEKILAFVGNNIKREIKEINKMLVNVNGAIIDFLKYLLKLQEIQAKLDRLLSFYEPNKSNKLVYSTEKLKNYLENIDSSLGTIESFIQELDNKNKELKEKKSELSINIDFSESFMSFVQDVKDRIDITLAELFSFEIKSIPINLEYLKVIKDFFKLFRGKIFELTKSNIEYFIVLKIACEKENISISEETKEKLNSIDGFYGKCEEPFSNFLNYIESLIINLEYSQKNKMTTTYSKKPQGTLFSSHPVLNPASSMETAKEGLIKELAALENKIMELKDIKDIKDIKDNSHIINLLENIKNQVELQTGNQQNSAESHQLLLTSTQELIDYTKSHKNKLLYKSFLNLIKLLLEFSDLIKPQENLRNDDQFQPPPAGIAPTQS